MLVKNQSISCVVMSKHPMIVAEEKQEKEQTEKTATQQKYVTINKD